MAYGVVMGISTPDRWSVDGCTSVYRVVCVFSELRVFGELRVFSELNDVGYE